MPFDQLASFVNLKETSFSIKLITASIHSSVVPVRRNKFERRGSQDRSIEVETGGLLQAPASVATSALSTHEVQELDYFPNPFETAVLDARFFETAGISFP